MDQRAVDRRLPAWHALSAFFVDTKLIDRDLAEIAVRLSEAGFGASEAEAILVREVAPVFHANKRGTQGTRIAWTKVEVRWQVNEFMNRWLPDRWVRIHYAKLFRHLYAADWAAVRVQLRP